MLEAAIIPQIVLGAYVEAAVVGGLLLFNATLEFIQEGRANAALAALKHRLTPTALVCRDGAWLRRPAAELVPGDAIRLALGAMVPAAQRVTDLAERGHRVIAVAVGSPSRLAGLIAMSDPPRGSTDSINGPSTAKRFRWRP